MLLVPSAMPRMFGRMVGSLRQGWTVLAVMAVLWGGAGNGAHDSFTALGGGALMANMMIGEVSPGGIGSGLDGLLALALLALVTPVRLLVGAAVAMSTSAERRSVLHPWSQP